MKNNTLIRQVVLGGVPVAAVTQEELAQRMVDDCSVNRDRSARPVFLSSVNGHVLSRYHREPSFKQLLDEVDILDADGMPLVLASRWLAPAPLPGRVATTDFIHVAARYAAQAGLKFYFLGGHEHENENAVARTREMHPNLEIVGQHHGFFDEADEPDLCRHIVESGADVLWVGMGVPREQQFIVRNRDRLIGVTWIKSCGGLYKFLAGIDPRAPVWMQNAGLEWVFRLANAPRQFFWRYAITSPHAMYLMFKHRALTKSAPMAGKPFDRPSLAASGTKDSS